MARAESERSPLEIVGASLDAILFADFHATEHRRRGGLGVVHVLRRHRGSPLSIARQAGRQVGGTSRGRVFDASTTSDCIATKRHAYYYENFIRVRRTGVGRLRRRGTCMRSFGRARAVCGAGNRLPIRNRALVAPPSTDRPAPSPKDRATDSDLVMTLLQYYFSQQG